MSFKNSNVLIQKVKTNVPGLDKLLYGGLNLVPAHNVVVVRSEDASQGTLFGLQLLFGLSQSMNLNGADVSSCFVSNHDDAEYLNSVLLDTVIASCIQTMIRKYVRTPKPEESLLNMRCGFAKTFFDITANLCNGSCEEKKTVNDISDAIDSRICEEAIYYSNRTHSLHERTLHSLREGLADSDSTNLLYTRKTGTYQQLAQASMLNADLEFPLVPSLSLSYRPNILASLDVDRDSPSSGGQSAQTMEFLVVDLAVCKQDMTTVCRLIERYKPTCRLLVIELPSTCDIPEWMADMVIDLKSMSSRAEDLDEYFMNYLQIFKSRNQMTALGKHFYKYRDYGIEVFPSLHTYFQKRRYLQRALVNTHSTIVADTYQQYLDKAPKDAQVLANYTFDTYFATRKQKEQERTDALFTNYAFGYSSVDVLESILIPRRDTRPIFQTPGCETLDYRGNVTGIIGDSNNYKRFITFGSIFSSSLDHDHTLVILLNKDAATIRRRMSCPARSKRGRGCRDCHECYKYIHFMDICMGSITADEFIYYLSIQLETPFDDGNSIKRVVIDDLQIVDFCFPFLKGSSLFLSALVAICREKGIQLYILCDKKAGKVTELRAVADSIVCTGRDKRGRLQLYIERYIGFNNTPSKIYCGTVNKVKDLFDCYYRMDGKEKKIHFRLNSLQICDDKVSSMKDYWK